MQTSFDGLRIERRDNSVTLLPDPERRERHFTIVSVDDHLVEAPHTFEGRLPSKFVERGPRVVDLADGGQAWQFDGHLLPNLGINAVAGRPPQEWSSDPTRFTEMRPGAWDIHHRIKDMDLDGVYMSLCFPSFLAGFGGARLQTVSTDLELGLAAVRAWNDWVAEEWAGCYPDRIVPLGLTWLHDPAIGAEEIRRNAARGFRALTFPEDPSNYGWPSIYSDFWDPIFQACEETDTAVNVHVGSGGRLPSVSPDAPVDVPGVLFGTYASMYTVEWLYSMVPVRFPSLRIVISEGGIGWVAGLLDRLEHCEPRYAPWLGTWNGLELSPAETLRRNFWFCAVDDPSSMVQLDRIGVDHVFMEVDYPHADTSWPNTQSTFQSHLSGLSADVIRKLTWQNAASVYGLDIPVAVQENPDAF